MYTEEYEERGTPIKDSIIKIVAVLVIIVTACITTRVMSKETYTNTENIDTNPYKTTTYKDNIEHINDVMLGYFDQDKLKEVGNKEYKITIADLINEGILVSVVDSYDKVCNAKESYVEIRPFNDNEYILKTNLKCSKEDDYVLKHLGHYNYCSDYLCEKEKITISTKTTKPTKTVKLSDTNKVNEDITEFPEEKKPYIPKEDVTKQFEYAKTTNANIGSWSGWSGWIKTSCDIKEENCDDKNPSCRRKIVLYERDEQVSTYKNKYHAPRKQLTQTTTSKIGGCTNYNYVVIDDVIYATNSVYTMINNISSATKSNQGNWEYKGEQSFDTPPSDTATTIYKFIKTNFENCEETCENKTLKYVYDVYEFTGTLYNASADANYLCKGSMDKTVAVYQTNNISDTSNRKEPVYGKVCYYNMKTRSVKNKGNTKTQYSTFNDETLLTKDYYYTGNVKDIALQQQETQPEQSQQ